MVLTHPQPTLIAYSITLPRGAHVLHGLLLAHVWQQSPPACTGVHPAQLYGSVLPSFSVQNSSSIFALAAQVCPESPAAARLHTELHYCFHDKLPGSLTMFLEVFRSTSPQITFPYNLYMGTVSFFSAVYDCQMLPAASQKKPRVLERRALHHSTHACVICCQWAFFPLCVEMNTFA